MEDLMAQFRELKPAEAVGDPDHVLIVKHDEDRFEVTGTAGAGKPDARFLTPSPFDDKETALACAQSFADAEKLAVIYVKGFKITPEPAT
jgi:hypothetical protein